MAAFPEYESFDGIGLANLVKQKVISPAELLIAAIERVEIWNPKVNAVIHQMYDHAQATIKNNIPPGPFQGVPFLLKDLLADYAGTPARYGSRFTHSWISPHDSEVVRRFKQAGLIIFGKTNIPEFGLSPVTEPALFGPTKNPWDLARTSGGSSGGSAAAVATGIVPMAHANDGAGSIRIPASYCGLFGLKPSRGRTPMGPDLTRVWQGMVVNHALTRSVRDSAALLDVIAGPEVGSPISLPKPESSFLACLDKPVRKLRVALIEKPFFSSTVDPAYLAALKNAAQLCQQLGHQVEPVSFTLNSDEVASAFMIEVAAHTAANIKMLAELFNRKPKQRELEKQTALLCEIGEKFSAADVVRARYILDRTEQQLAQFLQDYAVLLTPTMAIPPPVINGLKPTQIEEALLTLLTHVPYGPALRALLPRFSAEFFAFTPFTPLFNITGQPAMSVPLYWDEQGLPIGIQFAGRFGDEVTLLQLAHQLEQAQPWMQKRPNLFGEKLTSRMV